MRMRATSDRRWKWKDVYKRQAVFHRAFDCTSNPYESIETLIELGADRLLTSGLKPKAVEGKALLGALQSSYGNSIEILAGSGINASNARTLMEETGIRPVSYTHLEHVRTGKGTG